MTSIHDKEVNKIAECKLLHDIINIPKRAKKINICYYPILHGCMNTRKFKKNFKDVCILLDSGFSSSIIMRGGEAKNYIQRSML